METHNMNIETMNIETTLEPVNEEKYVGCVKWFNNKAGYGFVTITSENRRGSDIFVHHSAIKVKGEQYKYLVQGEYIELQHEFQAGEVCGIKGGKLMCETRRETRVSRSQYRTNNQVQTQSQSQTTFQRPRVRGQGPREQTQTTNTSEKKRGHPPGSKSKPNFSER